MPLSQLSQQIQTCQKCPRLRRYCQKIAREKRRAYRDETYWGKPVPGFGDSQARFLIVGLAPGAHGANRTGRVFTGDRSGEWLYRALFAEGFSNQPESIGTGRDQLQLKDAAVTCVVKCAPPLNSPSPEETRRCAEYFSEEMRLFLQRRSSPKVILALGQFAFKAILRFLGQKARPFKHGAEYRVESGQGPVLLLCSYHPSQQNTFTGKLTQPMFQSVFARARRELS